MGAIHMVFLRTWEVHLLLAQVHSTAPALPGVEALLGCTSKHCWPKTPQSQCLGGS